MLTKDTPEFKELEATIGRLHELVDALGYGYSSYNDERGHVVEVVKVVGEFVGAESLTAFKMAGAELEKMGIK